MSLAIVVVGDLDRSAMAEALEGKPRAPGAIIVGDRESVSAVAKLWATDSGSDVAVISARRLARLFQILPELQSCVACGPVDVVDDDGEIPSKCPDCGGALAVIPTEQFLTMVSQ